MIPTPTPDNHEDYDCRTLTERIESLEHGESVLASNQDYVLSPAIDELKREISGLRDLVTSQQAVINATAGRVFDLQDRVEALEASDAQTVRHAMDNDTDIADLRRRLAALEAALRQPASLDMATAMRLIEVTQDDLDEPDRSHILVKTAIPLGRGTDGE